VKSGIAWGQSQYSIVTPRSYFQGFVSKVCIVGTNLASALQVPVDASSKDEEAETTSFGEERVILVRDEQARLELQATLGDSALVLTILQSKGMEFNDVFLYDFFTASPYRSNFRILQGLLTYHYSSISPKRNTRY
jgi:superfamily I DNA/RNA helicase